MQRLKKCVHGKEYSTVVREPVVLTDNNDDNPEVIYIYVSHCGQTLKKKNGKKTRWSEKGVGLGTHSGNG
jgi:hypothetical protein